MSISTIRRQVKNVAYNFSDAQVKVREATSNDPWRPSTALMSEIADLTHNPMAFTEIMSIVWKRLNDSGKNWRHVDKSLVLLDFLIKCGHEKVAQQCRENVFTIETLKDFQHVEDNRDQGISIREKAKQITALLADEERLKNERTRAILTRNKFKKNTNSVGADSRRSRRAAQSSAVPGYEDALPTTVTEEEMQLQIALALSKEESEKHDEERKSDEVRLQMALEESQKEADRLASTEQGTVSSTRLTQSALDDLLSLGVGELVSANNQQSSSGAWNNMGMVDPWGVPQPAADNGGFANNHQLFGNAAPANDPWSTGPVAQSSVPQTVSSDPFAAWDAPAAAPAHTNATDDLFSDLLAPTTSLTTNPISSSNGARKTPEHFLGENANLVNMDDLLGTAAPTQTGGNPFLTSIAPAVNPNPFTAQQRKTPTLNEMRAAQAQAPPVPATAPRRTLPQDDLFADLF